MARYINADELIEKLSIALDKNNYHTAPVAYDNGLRHAMDIISRMDTVEVKDE